VGVGPAIGLVGCVRRVSAIWLYLTPNPDADCFSGRRSVDLFVDLLNGFHLSSCMQIKEAGNHSIVAPQAKGAGKSGWNFRGKADRTRIFYWQMDECHRTKDNVASATSCLFVSDDIHEYCTLPLPVCLQSACQRVYIVTFLSPSLAIHSSVHPPYI
jgi:hypothetical protein